MISLSYTKIANAIVLLFNPLAEVVIHDLKKNEIAYINGNLSKRSVGDPSLLDDEKFVGIDKIVYSKMNFDGRFVRSISIPLDENYLMCINCDVSVFSLLFSLSKQMITTEQQPESLFKNDWQEKLHHTIHDYLSYKSWTFSTLTNGQKKEIIKHLSHSGAFNEKNAADYIAKALNIGRATVFNYLKEWKKENDESL